MLSASSLPPLIEQPDSIVALDNQAIEQVRSLADRLGIAVTSIQPDKCQLWLGENGLALKVPAFNKPFSIDFGGAGLVGGVVRLSPVQWVLNKVRYPVSLTPLRASPGMLMFWPALAVRLP